MLLCCCCSARARAGCWMGGGAKLQMRVGNIRSNKQYNTLTTCKRPCDTLWQCSALPKTIYFVLLAYLLRITSSTVAYRIFPVLLRRFCREKRWLNFFAFQCCIRFIFRSQHYFLAVELLFIQRCRYQRNYRMERLLPPW